MWNKTIAVNTTGAFLGMKAASVELHKAGKSATVVNTASVFAYVGGWGNVPAYHTSKVKSPSFCLLPSFQPD